MKNISYSYPTAWNFIPLEGQIFGRLVVISFSHKLVKDKGTKVFWKCRCSCGKTAVVSASELRKKHTRSCGCYASEKLSNRNLKHGKAKRACADSVYGIWCGIKKRCGNPNSTEYKRYGARGIRVCERWNSFDNFLEDMGNRPSATHSIERIDNSKGYFPENCRWATPKEQANNTRRNVIVKINSKEMTLAQAVRSPEANPYSLSYDVVKYRVRMKWDAGQLFSPLRNK